LHYSIKRLIFLTEELCVYCAVRTEYLTLNPLTWKIWWTPSNASNGGWDLTRLLKD